MAKNKIIYKLNKHKLPIPLDMTINYNNKLNTVIIKANAEFK